MVPVYVDVCAAGDVPAGGLLALTANGRSFLLCESGGEFFALSDRCTHAAWCLADSTIAADEIVCSLHGGRFDLRTGEATAKPASKPIRIFPVRRAGERIEVLVPPPVGSGG